MLYWTDWGVSSIESASIDGVNRRKLITKDLVWPNGLTIDTVESRMFWVDASIDRYLSLMVDIGYSLLLL